MTLTDIFLNSHGRPRSGWRFLIFVLLFLFCTILVEFFVATVLTRVTGFERGTTASMFINSGVSLFLAIIIGWFCEKLLEGLPFRALGAAFTKYWLKHITLGVILGGVTILIAILFAVALGGLGFRVNEAAGFLAVFRALAASFVVFAVAAAFEEALCRGYVLQTFARAGLAWPAIILTALFFGAGHLGNPNVNWIAVANTVLAGVWFGIAWIRTRDLWLAFGMHFMWNWLQGSIFGIEVSGLKEISKAPLLLELDRGPAWLTGADYGLEGSISCTIALVVSTVAIYFLPLLKPDEELLAMTDRENSTTPAVIV